MLSFMRNQQLTLAIVNAIECVNLTSIYVLTKPISGNRLKNNEYLICQKVNINKASSEQRDALFQREASIQNIES